MVIRHIDIKSDNYTENFSISPEVLLNSKGTAI